MSDILLEKIDSSYYDISFENGDFKLTDGLDTAILMSLFTDKRADESEVIDQEQRRGWIGNEQNQNNDYEIGSKLWLLYQARVNRDSLNRAIDYAMESLSWMQTDGILKNINVSAEFISDGIKLNIIFTRFDNSSFSKQYNLWENTELV